MSKEYHERENFYTFEELKDFTNNFTDLTITSFTKFLEVKTANQYTVTSSEFIKDVNKLFLNHQLLIFKFTGLTNDIWEKLKLDNEKVVKKHQNTLSKFDIVKGK